MQSCRIKIVTKIENNITQQNANNGIRVQTKHVEKQVLKKIF